MNRSGMFAEILVMLILMIGAYSILFAYGMGHYYF